jgi:hypothetical protein
VICAERRVAGVKDLRDQVLRFKGWTPCTRGPNLGAGVTAWVLGLRFQVTGAGFKFWVLGFEALVSGLKKWVWASGPRQLQDNKQVWGVLRVQRVGYLVVGEPAVKTVHMSMSSSCKFRKTGGRASSGYVTKNQEEQLTATFIIALARSKGLVRHMPYAGASDHQSMVLSGSGSGYCPCTPLPQSHAATWATTLTNNEAASSTTN